MQLIPVEFPVAHAPGGPDGAVLGALAGVIAAVGEADFGHTALAQLNRWMPLCWWSVYRLRADQPPTVHAAGSCGVPDGTGEAWRVYRAGLYRRDESFAAARERVQGGQAVLTHWDARELPRAHRQQIYLRHGLRERLSIVQGDVDGGVLAINLYRHQDQAPFSDAAIDAMRQAAQPMLACVAKHLALSALAVNPARAEPDETPVAARAPVLDALTPREREVCARLLKGWTHEGVAADLQLSAATVKTYRDRAFRRLGIHHRNELFALVLECRP